MEARKTVVFLMVILIAIGTLTFISIPKDAEPDIDVPFIYVSVILPGISPEDSERLLVRPLESELKNIFGNEYIVTTNSATSAEHLALHLLKNEYGSWGGLKQGDEVLCTSLTCTATNWPVLANKLKIKWVDVDPKTLNMDLDDLARKITKDTKIIYLVHWGGYPIDLDKVKGLLNN
mgnify:CR=1 FL=1